eukprot:g5596.t1
MDVITVVIVCVLLWLLFYMRAYVCWTVWSVLSHVFLVASTLYVASHAPGLSKVLGVGPQRTPNLAVKKHHKMWREYVFNFEMFGVWIAALLVYSVVDYMFAIGFAWGKDAHAFPALYYYFVDYPLYYLSLILWVLLLVLGHVLLLTIVLYALSGYVNTAGLDNHWWGGWFHDHDFFLQETSMGDQSMTLDGAYKYLELSGKTSPSQDDIKKAYRKVCRKWHPDKNRGNPKAKEYFQKIQDAMVLLGPKAKRKERLKRLLKTSLYACGGWSALDLLSYILLGEAWSFFWAADWPMLWICWAFATHYSIAHAFVYFLGAASIPGLPKGFGSFRKALAVLGAMSLADLVLCSLLLPNSWGGSGYFIWKGWWPLPWLMAAPHQVIAILDAAPFVMFWLVRLYYSMYLLLRGNTGVLAQVSLQFRQKIQSEPGANENLYPLNALVSLGYLVALGITILMAVVDGVYFGMDGFLWRSRENSSYTFIVFTAFLFWFGKPLLIDGLKTDWLELFVCIVLLSPPGFTWYDAFELGTVTLLLMHCFYRFVVLTRTSMTLLSKTSIGKYLAEESQKLYDEQIQADAPTPEKSVTLNNSLKAKSVKADKKND